MPASRLTVYAYQDLIDQGWRRSGCYLYKPDLARSCCKAYTIRLDVQQFRPDKGQRRLHRKWRNYLLGEAPSGSGAGAGAAAPAPALTTNVSASELPTAATGAATTAADNDDMAGASGADGPTGHTRGRQRSAAGRRHDGTQAVHAAAAAAARGAAAAASALDSGARDAEADAEERALQQLLAAARTAAVATGDLPATAVGRAAPPEVRRCSEKQRAALPPDVRYTSAVAFPLAAAIQRGRAVGGATAAGGAGAGAAAASSAGASGQPAPPSQRKQALKAAARPSEGALSAQDVAQVLIRHFNELASVEAEPAASWRQHLVGKPEAYAANGHVNIRLPKPQQQSEGQQQCCSGADESMADALAAAPRPSVPRCSGPGASGGGGGSSGGCTKRCSRTSTPGGESSAGRAPAAAQTTESPQRGRRGAAAADAAAGRGGGGGGGSGGGGGPSNTTPDPDPDSLAMPSGRLEIRMVPSQFLQEEFELYKRYQVAQHGDKPWQLSRASYTRFLVDSPLPPLGRDADPEAPACGYGSFHQQYWLDGKLIAVGVVDVLPRCLSSVYLFWDTELAHLAPGRFSALQEILWVQRALPHSPRLRYYYMGFYIHTCPKMRYKAEYRPSDLLCPVRKVWVLITPQLLAAIDRQPFLELSAQQGAYCQPNLAAPQPEQQRPGAAPPATSAPVSAPESASASMGAEGGGGGVDDTLILIAQQGELARPVPFKVLRRLNVFSQRVLPMLERAIRDWRDAVGWAAPALVYQI